MLPVSKRRFVHAWVEVLSRKGNRPGFCPADSFAGYWFFSYR